MATHAGKLGKVFISANQIARVRNWKMDEEAKTADDTSMGDEFETHKVTTKSWTASCDCWWDESDTNGQQALTVGESVTLNLYPEGNASGATYYTGTATVTNRGQSGAFDGIVERTITFKGNGELSEAIVT